MHTRAVQAYVHAKGHAGPRRVAGLTIKTHLAGEIGLWLFAFLRRFAHFIPLLVLEDFKDLLGLLFCGIGHGLERSGGRWWMSSSVAVCHVAIIFH